MDRMDLRPTIDTSSEDEDESDALEGRVNEAEAEADRLELLAAEVQNNEEREEGRRSEVEAAVAALAELMQGAEEVADTNAEEGSEVVSRVGGERTVPGEDVDAAEEVTDPNADEGAEVESRVGGERTDPGENVDAEEDVADANADEGVEVESRVGGERTEPGEDVDAEEEVTDPNADEGAEVESHVSGERTASGEDMDLIRNVNVVESGRMVDLTDGGRMEGWGVELNAGGSSKRASDPVDECVYDTLNLLVARVAMAQLKKEMEDDGYTTRTTPVLIVITSDEDSDNDVVEVLFS